MNKISVYELGDHHATLDQLPLKRDWMDLTFDRHAYQCFPISLSNRLGWGISFPEDISFIWNGVNDSRPDHVTILKGHQYVHPSRGNRTISFNTGLYFQSSKNLSLLTMPVPNQFIDGATCMTTVLSTSVLENELPIAWIITRPNVEITIPAGTPIAAILPLSISDIQKNEVVLKTGRPKEWSSQEWNARMTSRSEASMKKNSVGDWTHFYRDALDHEGNSVGEHEAKKVILKVSRHEKN